MPTIPNISIIIPTLNEEQYIPLLLESLEKQSVKLHEIIVVDGNSIDDTQKIVKKCNNIKLLLSKPSVADQRNIGCRNATGDILFFFDADTLLKHDFVKKCITDFHKRNLSIACPIYIPINTNLPINSIYWLFNIIFIFSQKIQASGAGSCIMIKKSLIETCGGFDNRTTYDDIELIRRASYKGKFGILLEKIYVSPRRFYKQGVIKTFLQYLILSFFFMCNAFKLANIINYPFPQYDTSHRRKKTS